MFAPVISTELELQLEQWHSHLPEFLRFDRYSNSESNVNPKLLFLRTNTTYRAPILGLAVHQVAAEGKHYDKTLLSFYSASMFIKIIISCFECLPNAWKLCARYADYLL
jgi:hypothetical protein